MKKFLAGLLTLVSLFALVCFASCDDTKNPDDLTSSAKVIKNDEKTFAFTASSDADGTKFVYDYLVSFQDNGVMTFSASSSEYGYYIESVNGTTADSSKEYWALYTSVTTVDGVAYSTTEYGSYEIEGKKLGSANYGVSSLPVFAGETYVLSLSGF